MKDTIAENLRVLRDLRGLSQFDLAKAVGVSRRTIARLEAGEVADPGIQQVHALADALGVTTLMLMTERLVTVRVPVPVPLKTALTSPTRATVLAAMVSGGSEEQRRNKA